MKNTKILIQVLVFFATFFSVQFFGVYVMGGFDNLTIESKSWFGGIGFLIAFFQYILTDEN